ncbi:MAG: phage portal protein [Dehalococcoidia bacterium]
MPIDPSTAYGQAFAALAARLTAKRERLDLLASYHDGNPPLPEGAAGMRQAYQRFQQKSRTNYAELIVEATRERMIPNGFTTSQEQDPEGDALAWQYWTANALEVGSADVHSNMLGLGDGYTIVGGVDPDTGVPNITSEDPRQVITRHDPTRPRVVTVALKAFTDEWTGQDTAYLYTPGQVLVATRDTRDAQSALLADLSTWSWSADRSFVFPHKIVPVVRFQNRRGYAEFETHIDLLNRINLTILQRLVITAMQAYRQRALKKDPKADAKAVMPTHDDEGNEIDYNALFAPGPGALWDLPPGVELWESEQAQFSDILSAVKDDVRELAAVTRTPVGYLIPEGANQSAEGAAAMREGLVFKAEDRIARAKASWEQTLSIAFRFAGDDSRANLAQLKSHFRDPQRYSLTEMADAAVKATDLPLDERLVSIWGKSPADLPGLRAQRSADLLEQAAVAGVNRGA